MRACFLVPGLSRSGGIDVIAGHARRLGAEVVAVDDTAALDAARAQEWDVALASWWTTIPFLSELRAERRGVMAQGYDPLHYRGAEFIDRIASVAAVNAGYDVVAVSDWVADMVRAARPGARCSVVRPGIDKEVFGGAPRPAGDGPLRVLVEGQPSVWFKGVDEALAAAAEMARRPHVTVVALDPAAAGGLPADRVVGGLDAAGMAALYREADVVVKLSRFEGLGLAPIEAFHAGVPCVVTPYGGHREYLVGGENGLLVGFDDLPGTIRALDRLDADRGLLARLSEGALRTAEGWPDPAASTDALRAALDALGPGEQDPAALWPVLGQTEAARGELDELRAGIEELGGNKADLQRHLADAQDRVHVLGTQLEETRASRAYRAALALRALIPGRR